MNGDLGGFQLRPTSAWGRRWYPCFPGTTNLGLEVTDTYSFGTIHVVPFFSGGGGLIDRIAVVDASGSRPLYVGIYASRTVYQPLPGGLLANWSATPASGLKVFSLAFSSTPNTLYWVGLQSSSHSSFECAQDGPTPPLLGMDPASATHHRAGVFYPGSFTTGLPATLDTTGFGYLGTAATAVPLVWVSYG